MSGNDSSKITDPPPFNGSTEGSWDTVLVVFEVIEIHLIVITAWILGCLIIYGTKTGKWTKKAQASSLNSGLIYTAAVITIGLFTPKLALTEYLYHMPRTEKGQDQCEIMGDVATTGNGVFLYVVYLFLCIRQRLIYTHPYVRERVSRCMNWFSRIFFVILTAVAIGLIIAFWYPESFEAKPYGCIEIRNRISSIILCAVFVTTQSMTLALSIYPAVRIRLETSNDIDTSSIEEFRDGTRAQNIGFRAVFAWCRPLLCGGSEVTASPVEMTIRRTVVSCVIIVVSDLVALIIDAVVMPTDTPFAVLQTISGIGSLVSVFCVLTTFGFAGKVLTLCCPACPKVETRHEEKTDVTTVDTVA